jgi:hypothetical protein
MTDDAKAAGQPMPKPDPAPATKPASKASSKPARPPALASDPDADPTEQELESMIVAAAAQQKSHAEPARAAGQSRVSLPPPRSRWADRFREPDAKDLLAGLGKVLGSIADHARQRLAGLGAQEHIEWCGVWKWCLVVRAQERPLAFIIPDPARLVLALLVPDELITKLPLKKIPRFVRDGLAHAPLVDGVRWARWDVQSKAQVDEILIVCESQLRSSTESRESR